MRIPVERYFLLTVKGSEDDDGPEIPTTHERSEVTVARLRSGKRERCSERPREGNPIRNIVCEKPQLVKQSHTVDSRCGHFVADLRIPKEGFFFLTRDGADSGFGQNSFLYSPKKQVF